MAAENNLLSRRQPAPPSLSHSTLTRLSFTRLHSWFARLLDFWPATLTVLLLLVRSLTLMKSVVCVSAASQQHESESGAHLSPLARSLARSLFASAANNKLLQVGCGVVRWFVRWTTTTTTNVNPSERAFQFNSLCVASTTHSEQKLAREQRMNEQKQGENARANDCQQRARTNLSFLLAAWTHSKQASKAKREKKAASI